MKKLFLLFLILICAILLSCGKYSFFNDKNIISHKELVNEEWKFFVTVYFNNSNTYTDMPLEIGEIRDGHYEKKIEKILYERTFVEVFSNIFKKKTEIINNPVLKETYLFNVKSICDVKNRNGDILFWFSFDENQNNSYMILNGELIEKNNLLIKYVQLLLYSDTVILVE